MYKGNLNRDAHCNSIRIINIKARKENTQKSERQKRGGACVSNLHRLSSRASTSGRRSDALGIVQEITVGP